MKPHDAPLGGVGVLDSQVVSVTRGDEEVILTSGRSHRLEVVEGISDKQGWSVNLGHEIRLLPLGRPELDVTIGGSRE
jgi:hypothetical protein